MRKNRHLHINGQLEIDGVSYARLKIFDKMMNFKQENPYHPESNLFFHTWQVARQLEKENINLWLSGVFHDVGKLTAFQQRENEKGPFKTFYGHDKASVAYIKKYLSEHPIFQVKGVLLEKILWLVDQHLRVMMYQKMGPKKRKTLNTHKWWRDLKKLRIADEEGRKKVNDIRF